MNEREKRKEELLKELSRRFRDSASIMKGIAARVQAAATESHEHSLRINNSGRSLRESVEGNSNPLPFSYLEFLEFESAQEFEKYRDMPVISEDDIKQTDMDELCRRLCEEQ